MVNITPEEKEKIIQLFETQEVDNLLLVYSLLEGFGLNILDCDWLIKDYFSIQKIFLPINIEICKDLNFVNKQVVVFEFYYWDSSQWSYRYETSVYLDNKFTRFEYLDFKIDMRETLEDVYLEFISEIKDIQNYQSINL